MASHRRPATSRIRRRSVPVVAALLTAVAVAPALLVDAGAGTAPVVHTVPASPVPAAPTVAPAGPAQADRCGCPVRLWIGGVEQPPLSPRPPLRVCALGGACLDQSAGPVVDGPVTR